MLQISQYIIEQNKTIKEAISKINNLPRHSALILFVTNEKQQVIGSITDGDIRRGLISGNSLDCTVDKVMQKDFKYIKDLNDYKKANEFKKASVYKIIPYVTEDFHLIDLIDFTRLKSVLPVDAVIMAGGQGVRLKPYTQDTPKPLLELDEKPILGHNIDRLLDFGIKNIYISVNHMKEQIISYVEKNYNDCNIKFIEENKPLGTVGSVRLAEEWQHDDILLLNADILTNIDFFDFFFNYKELNNDMSVATFNVRINVPYGILETEGEKVTSLIEKPSFTYNSNAGIYLFKREMVKYIPQDIKYDSTELMEKLIEEKKYVSYFPIRGYWLDIGNVQNYAKAQDDIRYIKF